MHRLLICALHSFRRRSKRYTVRPLVLRAATIKTLITGEPNHSVQASGARRLAQNPVPSRFAPRVPARGGRRRQWRHERKWSTLTCPCAMWALSPDAAEYKKFYSVTPIRTGKRISTWALREQRERSISTSPACSIARRYSSERRVRRVVPARRFRSRQNDPHRRRYVRQSVAKPRGSCRQTS